MRLQEMILKSKKVGEYWKNEIFSGKMSNIEARYENMIRELDWSV